MNHRPSKDQNGQWLWHDQRSMDQTPMAWSGFVGLEWRINGPMDKHGWTKQDWQWLDEMIKWNGYGCTKWDFGYHENRIGTKR